MIRHSAGNVGIAILTQLLVILLTGFFAWGLLPLSWREYVKAGPWKAVAVAAVGLVILIAVTRELFGRREHKRAHRRVAKVFRETSDQALEKRSALWLIDQDRHHSARLANAGLKLFDVLVCIMNTVPEKMEWTRVDY